MHIIVQDDLLAKVIFGEFACEKLIGEFYIGHVPLSMLRLKQKWRILYWQFLHRTTNRQYKFLTNKLSCTVWSGTYH